MAIIWPDQAEYKEKAVAIGADCWGSSTQCAAWKG